MKFIDLFAGLGGFHVALSSLGHECVFASEVDSELREVYLKNFPEMRGRIFGDIRESKIRVPKHDVLCAGFPCQPFSKSGAQAGLLDKTRGTLFHEILEILAQWKPKFVLLENVGNFERHDSGRTWKIVRKSLQEFGYEVWGTEHVTSGGHGLISPHHLGFPHTRERFFVVASQKKLSSDPFPSRTPTIETSLKNIQLPNADLTPLDRVETHIDEHYVRCIDHWNVLLERIPSNVDLPSFPIWGDELGAKYPFQKKTPYASTAIELRKVLSLENLKAMPKRELVASLPNYARTPVRRFPDWKVAFIRQNREWFEKISPHLTKRWISTLNTFPPSLRKLEWNCQGEERNLWKHVLQFRPSGLRVKRYSSSPALVAMTTTQVPILGPKKRFISRVEGLRLQGLADDHALPVHRDLAFRALGNAVHVGVVRAIAERAFGKSAKIKSN